MNSTPSSSNSVANGLSAASSRSDWPNTDKEVTGRQISTKVTEDTFEMVAPSSSAAPDSAAFDSEEVREWFNRKTEKVVGQETVSYNTPDNWRLLLIRVMRPISYGLGLEQIFPGLAEFFNQHAGLAMMAYTEDSKAKQLALQQAHDEVLSHVMNPEGLSAAIAALKEKIDQADQASEQAKEKMILPVDDASQTQANIKTLKTYLQLIGAVGEGLQSNDSFEVSTICNNMNAANFVAEVPKKIINFFQSILLQHAKQFSTSASDSDDD